MREHIDKNRRTDMQTAAQPVQPSGKGGERVIYRKAGDDWF